MSKPVETLLFEYLEEKINSAISGDALNSLELHDTIYQAITTDRGLRISDVTGEFSPRADMIEAEYDVFVTIAVFSRVAGSDGAARIPAMTDVFEIQRAVYAVLRSDPSLGGRVCDSLLRRGGRSYDSWDGEPYAVAAIPLIINPSGVRYAGD